MYRRGSMTDIPIILAVVFGVAIAAIMAQLVVDEFQASNTEIDSQYMSAAEGALNVFNGGIVFITVAMYMVSIIFAFRIPTSPIYFIPSTIMLLLSTWVAAVFGNTFQEIINVSAVTGAANQFPMMIALFENFPIVMLGFGLLLEVAMFVTTGERSAAGVAAR